jgi:hypothetical protein
MTLPEYAEVAERLGVPLCNRDCVMRSLNAHQVGFADYTKVHWKDRIVTRRGLWNFLKLVAEYQWGSFDLREIQRIWLRNTVAYELGLDLGIRFPHEFADVERARTRAILASHRLGALDEETHRRIKRWAR